MSTLPLATMSRTEKLQAMEALWVDLTRDEKAFVSPAWHAAALAEAEAKVKSGQAQFMDWAAAKRHFARRRP